MDRPEAIGWAVALDRVRTRGIVAALKGLAGTHPLWALVN